MFAPPVLVLVFVSLAAMETSASLSLDVDVVAMTTPVSSLSDESEELSRVNGVLRICAALCQRERHSVSLMNNFPRPSREKYPESLSFFEGKTVIR